GRVARRRDRAERSAVAEAAERLRARAAGAAPAVRDALHVHAPPRSVPRYTHAPRSARHLVSHLPFVVRSSHSPGRRGIVMSRVWWFVLVLYACAAPAGAQSLTIAQAVEEAVQHNLALMAERSNLSIADAQMVTARLRPNPVFSFSADHLDVLGTGFSAENNGGPP